MVARGRMSLSPGMAPKLGLGEANASGTSSLITTLIESITLELARLKIL